MINIQSRASFIKIIEAFQDNMRKQAEAAGSIFCDPLNGKYLEFPLTMSDFSVIQYYQMTMLRKKNLGESICQNICSENVDTSCKISSGRPLKNASGRANACSLGLFVLQF